MDVSRPAPFGAGSRCLARRQCPHKVRRLSPIFSALAPTSEHRQSRS